ncbi:hypothetical protein L7F22_008217 [Adiantum nelumboides]|nr:hypothetical protein [Adiantum nelumboides]
MKEKQKESASGSEPSRWEYFSRMEDLLGSTPKVSGLVDGFTGDDFVNPELVSLAEDEDIGTEDNDAGVGVHGEPDTHVHGSGSVAGSINNNIGDTHDEDAIPGPSIGQSIRGQKVKKRRAAIAIEGLGGSIERGCGIFAKTLERIELRRLELEEKRLDAQVQIAHILASRSSSPPRSPPHAE